MFVALLFGSIEAQTKDNFEEKLLDPVQSEVKLSSKSFEGDLSLEPGTPSRFGFKISSAASARDRYWDKRFALPGLDGWVNAVEYQNNDIYAAGSFSSADGEITSNIAKWNGYNWEPLGIGTNGPINALEIVGNNLFVGGEFSKAGGITASNVARYNITSGQWFALGGANNEGVGGLGTYSRVYALQAESNGNLLVGGYFTQAGPNPANAIARWNGITWSTLGSGLSSAVYDIDVDGSTVVAGGRFTESGGNPMNRIARWNGASWSSLGSGVNGDVYTVKISGPSIYVGGKFTQAGGNNASNIARWGGSAWNSVGAGTDDPVFSIEKKADGSFVVGGTFENAGGTNSPNIAILNGNSWSSADGGVTTKHPGAGVFATVIIPASVSGIEKVIAVGKFSAAGSIAASQIAEYKGATWSSMSVGQRSGVNGPVRAIVSNGSDILVGGYFSATGTVDANNIAKWNKTTSTWSEIGGGLNHGAVLAIATSGSNIFAGGNFEEDENGAALNGIAKFDGSSWVPLGTGVDGSDFPMVHAIATGSGGDVFVGGNFITAGGTTVNGIARWNDSSQQWFAMGSGVTNGSVHAIEVIGNDVYVGGTFQYVDGQAIKHFAKWSSANGWSAVENIDDNVYALDAAAGVLYVGGAFTNVGSLTANKVAKYTLANDTWSTLGTGLGADAVSALKAFNATTVTVAGSFDTADGSLVSGLAYYNGSWTDLGSGGNEPLRAIDTDSDGVWVGGYFSQIGSNASYHFGRYSTNNLIASCSVVSGWNMVSVPMTSNNMAPEDWYPGALPAPSTLFSFDPGAGYVASDPVENGVGYWGLFDQADTYNVAASGFQSNRVISVSSGWNLIGSFESNVDITDITSSPANNVISDYFGFDNGYQSESILQACGGYWVLVSQDGSLTLPGINAAAENNGNGDVSVRSQGSQNDEFSLGKIIITDAAGNSRSLTLLDNNADLANFMLPPTPPNGVLDLRFEGETSGQKVLDLNQNVLLSGAIYPITVQAEFENELEITLSDAFGGQLVSLVLSDGSEFQIDTPLDKYHVSSSVATSIGDEIPEQARLMQNYPNPFNPETTISYSIDKANLVSLQVFNSLGQQVATLVNGPVSPGEYSVSFDATDLPSGTYFYMMSVGEQLFKQKMTLIK